VEQPGGRDKGREGKEGREGGREGEAPTRARCGHRSTWFCKSRSPFTLRLAASSLLRALPLRLLADGRAGPAVRCANTCQCHLPLPPWIRCPGPHTPEILCLESIEECYSGSSLQYARSRFRIGSPKARFIWLNLDFDVSESL